MDRLASNVQLIRRLGMPLAFSDPVGVYTRQPNVTRHMSSMGLGVFLDQVVLLCLSLRMMMHLYVVGTRMPGVRLGDTMYI